MSSMQSSLTVATSLVTALLTTLCLGQAQASTLTVGSTTDIWLAGQPDGTTATGNWGSDTAPTNSPLMMYVSGGSTLRFSASGSTSVDTYCFAGPDGGCYADESGFSPPPGTFYGIGSYKGPSNALIGVFLDNSAPSGVDVGGPASLDFTLAANVSQSVYTPVLNQIFFIGDGMMGTGTGNVQQFVAPTGATRLFIAVADSYGSSTGNLGALAVGVNVATVPEPESYAMLLAGLGLLGFMSRRRPIG